MAVSANKTKIKGANLEVMTLMLSLRVHVVVFLIGKPNRERDRKIAEKAKESARK